MRGQMYCFQFLDNHQSTIDYAIKVLSANDVKPNVMEDAYLFMGNSYKEMKLSEKAIFAYKQVLKTTNNIKAAEAKYGICEILFDQQKNAECEQQIMEMVQQKPSYDFG
jgi:tetratricopeptide (TPR) repeat protein